jgi:hypothetical protein
MNALKDHAVYRIRQVYHKNDKPKKYRYTFKAVDEHSGQVMAACDLIGKAVFATLEIFDHNKQAWQMKPNRKIMPSRWKITDPNQQIVMQFDQKIFGKLVNPLYKIALALLDGNGKELYRLVDPRKSIPDRIMSSNIGEWTILDTDKPVAKLCRLPKEKEIPKGFLGKLKRFFAGSDQAIISIGKSHLLPAPVAVAMIMLFEELTDVSAE